MFPNRVYSQRHHFEERAVFAGCGVRAVETNESNTYRRTERGKQNFGTQLIKTTIIEYSHAA